MKSANCDKMIIAILQNDSYHEVVSDLNEHGFYATVLHSSGAFLKEASATIMIGVNHDYLDEALEILKAYGKRTEVEYKPATTAMGMAMPPIAMTSIPVSVHRGGIVLFVTDISRYERY